MSKITAYDGQGRLVRLGKEIGRGGEGSIFDVVGHEGIVSKVYHKPVSGDNVAKIMAMVEPHNESLLRLASWPVNTLHKAQT